MPLVTQTCPKCERPLFIEVDGPGDPYEGVCPSCGHAFFGTSGEDEDKEDRLCTDVSDSER